MRQKLEFYATPLQPTHTPRVDFFFGLGKQIPKPLAMIQMTHSQTGHDALCHGLELFSIVYLPQPPQIPFGPLWLKKAF